MTTTMLETVAKAIMAAHMRLSPEIMAEVTASDYMDAARAALTALREPTPEMMEAMLAELNHRTDFERGRLGDARCMFSAAIDAALSTPTKG